MKLRHTEDGKYIFYCPGCKCGHGFNHVWSFDGDMENPTVSPSLLTKDNAGSCCHLFIKKGMLHFLRDCTHEFAGKVMAMVDAEEVFE
jgi:hypothetical protein